MSAESIIAENPHLASVNQSFTWQHMLLAQLFIALLSLLFGAVPFVMAPEVIQQYWAVSFASSMAENFSIFAHNIGYPHPAAPSFGLPGMLVNAVFIAMGLSGIDAYSAMSIFFIVIAFWGAYKLSLESKISITLALFFAFLWFSAPIIWWHVGYSFLAIGFSLLPLYSYASYRLWHSKKVTIIIILFMFFSCGLSLFMDGYSFVMFFCASVIIAIALIVKNEFRLLGDCKYTIIIHAFSFMLAYLCYSLYIQKSSWPSHSLDFFRGWGSDISYFIISTKGVHALFDWIGFSQSRHSKDHFGDDSVWRTTFMLPALFCFIWGMFRSKNNMKWGFFLIVLFGLYMSLGPSVKFFSIRPEGVSQLMPKSYAVFPTGSGLISEFLPGFSTMRASYRWLVLGWFGIWNIIILLIASYREKRRTFFGILIICILAITNLPEPRQHIQQKKMCHVQFETTNNRIIAPLRKYVSSGDRVLFLPLGNDFAVSYIVSQIGGIYAYNIASDKNVSVASEYWPREINDYLYNPTALSWENSTAIQPYALFAKNLVDVLVLTHFRGPGDLARITQMNPRKEIVAQIAPVLTKLNNEGLFETHREEWFSVIKIPEKTVVQNSEKIMNLYETKIENALKSRTIDFRHLGESANVLEFYGLSHQEPWGRWSDANLNPVVKLLLSFPLSGKFVMSINAVSNIPQVVTVRIGNVSHEIDVHRRKTYQIPFDLPSSESILEMNISNPASPMSLGINADTRAIGIGISEIAFKILTE